MDARVVELARLLRRNGLPVSPAEAADAVAAAALVGVETRQGLRDALAAALVKRSADLPIFDAAFELHFSGLGRVLAAAERSLLEALRSAGLLAGDELEMVIRRLEAAAAGLGPLGQAAVAGDRAGLLRLLRAAALQIDFSLLASARGGFGARRLLDAAGGADLAADRAAVEAALREAGLAPPVLDALTGELRAAFAGVEAAARAWAEAELAARARVRPPDALPAPGAPAAQRRRAPPGRGGGAPAGGAAARPAGAPPARPARARWRCGPRCGATWGGTACRRSWSSGGGARSGRTWWCSATSRSRCGR